MTEEQFLVKMVEYLKRKRNSHKYMSHDDGCTIDYLCTPQNVFTDIIKNLEDKIIKLIKEGGKV